MWKPTIKGLIAHKLRLALTTLAVVLGVAFVAGTFVLTDTMSSVFDSLLSDATSGVDVFVRAEAGFDDLGAVREPIPAEILGEVRAVDGVAVADGSVEGYAQIVDKEGEAIVPIGPPTLGFSWSRPPLSPLVVRDGREPEAAGEIVIDIATARANNLAVGNRVTILTQSPPEQFDIVGLVGFGEADNLAGATLTAFVTEEAQRLFGLEGLYTSIEVAAEPGVSAETLRARIQPILPADLAATTADDVVAEQTGAIREALGFFNIALLVFAGVALFVGAFLIANTFTIVVAQRTREFALLRALGATGRQVTASVLIEASIVGVIASVTGVGLGALVAIGLQAMMRAFGLSLPSGDLVIAPRTILVAMAVGMGVTLVSAVLPARQAARIEPMAALREATIAASGGMRTRIAAGVPVVVIGGTILGASLLGLMPNNLIAAGVGALIVFIGTALLSPLVVRPLAGAVGAAGARLGVPGQLAQGNAQRNPRRTAATASALMIGLALVSFVAVMASSLRVSVGETLERELRADFILQGPAAQTGGGFSTALARELTEQPEFAVVNPQRWGAWRNPETERMSFLIGIDARTIEQVAAITVIDGSFNELGGGTLGINESVAEDRELSIGDEFPMLFARGGERLLRVAVIYEPTRVAAGDYIVSIEMFESLYTQQQDNAVFIKLADGVDPGAARQTLDATLAAYPGVEATNQLEFRQLQEERVGQILGLVTALLLLAVIIALLGITNTLALSVFERTREIGLLRAVGMTRRQTRSMIRWEALIVAVTGAIVGVGLGLVFGFAVVQSLRDEGLSTLAIPVGLLVVYVIVAGVAGVVAGVFPARRAARLDVLRAITVE